MRIELDSYTNKEDDGVDGHIHMCREEVDDLYALASLFQDFTVALGFTYVKSVGFEKDDETLVWSDF